MEFRFHINITEEDYMEFNQFHMLRSPYGKKQLKSLRISITGICLMLALPILIVKQFTAEAFLIAAPFMIVWIIVQLGLRRFMLYTVKRTGKHSKKAESPHIRRHMLWGLGKNIHRDY